MIRRAKTKKLCKAARGVWDHGKCRIPKSRTRRRYNLA